MANLRFGIKLSQDATIDEYKAVWRIADEARFDHCWNMDHFASLGPDDSLDIFEAWTLLAGMAAHTSHTESAAQSPATPTGTPLYSRRRP